MGYALPTSRKYLAWYMQQQRKKRVASEPTAVQRFFTRLNSTLTQYYTIPTWTASGDFEIEWRDTVLNPSSSMDILGRFDSADGFVRITGLTYIPRIRVGNVSVDSTAAFTVDGKLHVRGVRLEGDDFTFSEDGVDISVVNNPTAAANALIIDLVARSSSGRYVDGYIANVSLQTAGDNRFYALDEDLSTTSVIIDSIGGNNGTAINIAESQLFTEVADGWEGVERVTTTELLGLAMGWPANTAFVSTDLSAGARYKVTSSVSVVASDSRGLKAVNPETNPDIKDVTPGSTSQWLWYLDASGSNLGFATHSDGFSGDLRDISAKQFLEVAP